MARTVRSEYEDLPWNKILSFLTEMSAVRDVDSFFGTLFAGIGKLIPFDHSAQWFRMRNSDDKGIWDAFAGGKPSFCCVADSTGNKSFVENFNNHFWPLQPPPARKEAYGYAVDYDEWENTEFYCDFIRPEGIGHSLVPAKKNIRYSFTLQRGRKSAGFNERDKLLIGLVSPHLDGIYSCLRKIDSFKMTLSERIDLGGAGYRLTGREEEIVKLTLFRFTADEAAALLCISRRTIEKHLADVYEKLNIRSRQELYARFTVFSQKHA